MSKRGSWIRPKTGGREKASSEELKEDEPTSGRTSSSQSTPHQVAYIPPSGPSTHPARTAQISPPSLLPRIHTAGSPIIYPDAHSIPVSLRETRIHPAPLPVPHMPRYPNIPRSVNPHTALYTSLPVASEPGRPAATPFSILSHLQPHTQMPQAGIFGPGHQSFQSHQPIYSAFEESPAELVYRVAPPAERTVPGPVVGPFTNLHRAPPGSTRSSSSLDNSSIPGFDPIQGDGGRFGSPSQTAYPSSFGERDNFTAHDPTPRRRTEPSPMFSMHLATYRGVHKWRVGLEIIQQPERGLALDREPLRQATHGISPPIILRLLVTDEEGTEVNSVHPSLVAALPFLVVTATLMSGDGTEERAQVRFRDEVEIGIPAQQKFTASSKAIPRDKIVASTIGILSASPQFLWPKPGEPKQHYYIFEHLVVRPVGRFRMRFTLVNLAGPDGGTSQDVTPVVFTVFTDPFDVTESWDGPVPLSELTNSFADQGVKGLRKGTRYGGHGSEGESE